MREAGACRESAVGFVLAGGESRRMGQDKALMPFCGLPLVANAVRILREARLEVRIAGALAALEEYAPVVADAERGQGPLGGICAALSACEGRPAVFLPVDMPLVPPSLIACLVGRAKVTESAITVVSGCGFAQTFPAVVDGAALNGLETEMRASRKGCFAAFQAAAAELGQAVDAVPVEYLAQAGKAAHPCGLPASLWLLNVNSPDELRGAEGHSGRQFA